MKIDAFLMSCPARASVREATLASFSRTDWPGPLVCVIDDQAIEHRVRAITATWRRLLERALASDADFLLLLEDDVEFNRHLHHNLQRWAPPQRLGGTRPFFGSLYNAQRPYLLRNAAQCFFVMDPSAFWGSQALLLSRVTVGYLLRFWDPEAAADVLTSRLAARIGPLYQHLPSLVQHTGAVSTWGGIQHAAPDFDPDFRATGPTAKSELELSW
jgi:hypothetical protein